jgi:hypothetical protein
LLQFNSSNHFQAFIVGLDSLQAKWTYYPGDETFQSAGNQALNAVDSFYGITSLRRKLAQDEFNVVAVVDSLAISIIDPDLENTLNDKLEFIIGDTIYKFVSFWQVAVIPNKDMVALESVRANGLKSDHSGVYYYNQSQNYFYSYGSPTMLNSFAASSSSSTSLTTQFSSPCGGNVRLYGSAELGNSWNEAYLKIDLYSPNGDCSYARDYTVDWGDGNIETYPSCQNAPLNSGICNIVTQGCSRRHLYNTALIPATGSRTFTIKISAKYATSSCDPTLVGQVFQKEITYTVFSPSDCKKNKYKKDILDPSLQFTYNGELYRVRGKIGQNPRPFFNGGPRVFPKVWAEVIFEKKVGTSWRKTSPYYTNSVKLSGFYKENCATFSAIPLGIEYTGNAKSYTKKWALSNNSGTTTLSDYQFKCDIQTRHLVGNYGLQGVKLW